MEIRLMYPELIPYVIIASIVVLLFAWKKKDKFKKGVIVANAGYVKNTTLYKSLRVKYVIYKTLIIFICLLLIGIGTVMTTRVYKEDKKEETKEYYNRDIILCLDYSGSMGGIIKGIVDQYIQIVENLKGDRFGIVVFGGAPSTILPLTDDYDYAISVLKRLNNSNSTSLPLDRNQESVWDWSGMRAVSCCSSSDGDGLAASVLNFDKDDNRTKVVVLAADHGVGNYIVSLNDAVELAKKNGVKVYYVDGGFPSNYVTMNMVGIPVNVSEADNEAEKVNAATATNGKYYDAHNLSVNQIVKDIDSLDKTLLVEKNVQTVKTDLPEILFTYLLYLLPVLFILDWRIRT